MHGAIARQAWLVILAWGTLTLAAAAWFGGQLRVDSDLRLFLPEPATQAEKILLEELREGPGTRFLLVGLDGLPTPALAAASENVAARLRELPRFSRVENGTLRSEPQLAELLLRYRYLLSPRPGGCACDPASLKRELDARLLELGSPAGAVMQDLLLRDPTGELQAILDAWLPANQPQLIDGVWFSRAGDQALLMAQTKGAGFNADEQRLAVAAIREAVALADPSGALKASITGPGAFTVLLEQSVRQDVTRLGALAGIASVLFLFVVLRSVRHTLLGVLTLATTGLAAIVGVSLLNPSVHGITLAFGFTLLGVAMDYPVHLMIHLDKETAPRDTLGHVWPTLRLSIVTTCVAYLALILTGFTGLTQLGTFTVCGLIATGIVIRWLLPRLVEPRDARSPPLWLGQVDRLPRLPVLPPLVLAMAIVVVATASRPLFSNDLGGLTPVPQDLQAMDTSLRIELGAPDLRYVIAIRDQNVEAVLQRDEALRAGLERLESEDVIGAFEAPSRLLPSVRRQTDIQRNLPTSSQLNTDLAAALANSAFREDAFTDFVSDLDASRQLPPLTLASLAGTTLADRLDAVLRSSDSGATALVTLSDVRDVRRLEDWARKAGEDVVLLDLTKIAEELVERYRALALLTLGGALVVIALVLLVQLGMQTAIAVVLPVLATLAATVAILHLAGTALTLFHVVSLLLVGGLSFDYGLFFNRREATSGHALRTRYSVMVCWLSTAGAFALLTLSAMPVLQAIGSTVTLGVTLGFALALLARRRVFEVDHAS